MAQFLRPDSDVVTSADWTTTPYWSNLDETTASDTDFIVCANNANATIELGLSDVDTPISGTRTLRIRCRKGASAGNTRGLDYNLKENGTSVQSGTVNAALSEVYSTVAITISNTITNYSLLTLELTSTGTTGGAGGNRRTVEVSWVEFEIPDRATQNIDETLTFSINITDNRSENIEMIESLTFNTNTTNTLGGGLNIDFNLNFSIDTNIVNNSTYIFDQSMTFTLDTTFDTLNAKSGVFIIKNKTNGLFFRSSGPLIMKYKK